MDELLRNILILSLLLALITAPLGCFVVWRRMAYFGSALSHSALLGIVIGIVAGISVFWGMIATALLMSLFLLNMQKKHLFSEDSLLGLLAHVTLAAGLVLLALIDPVYIDLNSYLFGDILSIENQDIVFIAVISIIVAVIFYYQWKDWLLLTINEDIAIVEGVNAYRAQLSLMLTLALVIASAIKLTGLLLITSLLIIPAITARYLSKTPVDMIWKSIIFSLLGALGGLLLSYQFDLPAGPAIVLSNFLFFIIASVYHSRAA